jgi:hypothetical protein
MCGGRVAHQLGDGRIERRRMGGLEAERCIA